MKTIHIIILFLFMLPSILTKCSDQLSCFKNKLFNFGSPGQSIYPLSDITNTTQSSNLNILAYGDFNNDLHTDFIAQNLNNLTKLTIYSWNPEQQIFNYNVSLDTTQCPVSSVFLYDIDFDGMLDVVVWGASGQSNCILPYLHQSGGTFTQGSIWIMQKTSNPFVISYGANNIQKTIGLLVFQNGTRTILKYQPQTQNFIVIPWATIFVSSTNYATVPFSNPHWNSYLDITGDCQSDIIITDSNNNIQLWINQNGAKFQYQTLLQFGSIISLSFSDMNYDGVIDLLIGYPQQIKVIYNQYILKQSTDFCKPQYTSVTFNLTNSINYVVPVGYSLLKNNMQVKDINIDGFPDLLVVLNNKNDTSSNIIKILLNSQGKEFYQNDQYKLPAQPQPSQQQQDGQGQVTFNNVISASFIDFWENGILDIIVCTNQGMFSFYNNYLQQNLFFIKGYGASGQSTSKGAQVVGASFYWINSVGDGYRTTYQPQIPQTAYNALQTPYSYCGLGRANNYVQSFTLGIYGTSNSWSPIIPNSQLAVYAQSANPKQWAIRIYVLPTQSLVYVIIVSVIVLSILGIVLVILKCKNYRKKEQPMMEFIH